MSADGLVEWLDPAGQCHRSEPVDHLGATQERVLDTAAGRIPGHIPGHVASHSSSGDGGGDDGGVDVDGGPAACDEDRQSVLEQTLAIVVEHATAGSTTARVPSGASGGGGRWRTALSGEEIDELSRALRAGRFTDIGAAVRTRRAEAAEQAAVRERQGRQGCRVDHHVPPREDAITIKIKRKTCPSHRDRQAPTQPAPSLPPF